MSRTVILFILISLSKIGYSQFQAKNLAILYDNKDLLSSHSVLFDILKTTSDNDFDLMHLKSSFSLILHQTPKYHNVAVLVTSNQKWTVSTSEILKFADAGGNVLLMGSNDTDRDFSILLTEFGFINGPHRILIDHSRTVSKDTGLVSLNESCVCQSFIFKSSPSNPILFSGRGFAIDITNPMTFSILHGTPDSYLGSKIDKIATTSLAHGSNIVLVGGVEFRNLARAVITASIDSFNNNVLFSHVPPQFTHSHLPLPAGNLQILIRSIEWVMQRRGVLRVSNPIHFDVKTGETMDEYIVDHLLQYSVTIEEQELDGTWKPFVNSEVQLEINRLTTFGRVNYNVSDLGRYSARFYSPDFIGIYGLQTRLRHLGYTTLDHQVKIVIRPRRHTDYDRFITGAFPYYLTTFVMIGLAFTLVFVLLNQKDVKLKEN